METMTSRWTDDRMDDLKHQVDELGRRMEIGFAEQRNEMNARFDRLEKSLEVRFEKVDERFDKVYERFDEVDERFERVDERFDKVYERFERVDERFDKVDERSERVDERFERVDAKFERVDARFDVVSEQIARMQETVNGLYAMLARFSLWFAGTVAVAILAAILALLLR
jgi:chromosome segregation ATPase